MSNWEYGQEVPTSPWRSAMSIPREVGLRQTAAGIRLGQKPAREMESLRGKNFRFEGGALTEANTWLAKNHIQGDQLEIEAVFAPQSAGVEGIKLLKGAGEETVIGLDRDKGTVFVDRSHSGNVSFNPKFSGKYEAPLAARDGKVKLHIFVDACSVEVFVDDGETVFTVLVYPSADSRGVEFFGPTSGTKIGALNVWKLKSSWK
jgi:sucrose-6-phosphate hydrolase SacC (GH32 family)